jgi:uncharacterized Zn finger protein (UPF0148 family)
VISSSCPSCGAPITFQHAASVVVVCTSCDSTVARQDEGVKLIGKATRFIRELSPIQVGARGKVGSRGFQVVGGLRRARSRVRWNEWFLRFEDGESGWLGEGNGQFQLYDSLPELIVLPPSRPRPGARLAQGETEWVVVESQSASIVAIDGELPFVPRLNVSSPYLDVRTGDGKVGTVDYTGQEPVLWVGRVVELSALTMEGLRAFAGWSDPVLVNFAGPELTLVQTLQCPNCSAPLPLHAPGNTSRYTCPSCGSSLNVAEEAGGFALQLIEKAQAPLPESVLKLGAKGKLAKIDWEIIGVMARYVVEDGEKWVWTEYLLFNPYRGFSWLVQATDKSWSHVELITEQPEHDLTHATLRNKIFAFKEAGVAIVDWCVGEFTWEVHVEDKAKVADYINGKQTLSREETGEAGEGEVVWSSGWRVSELAVIRAFGSPEQIARLPKPEKYSEVRTFHLFCNIPMLVFSLLLLAYGYSVFEPKVIQQFEVPALGDQEGTTWTSPPFEVSGSRTRLEITSSTTRLVTLTRKANNRIRSQNLDRAEEALYANFGPGTYEVSVKQSDIPALLTVTQDPASTPCFLWLVVLYQLSGLGLLPFYRSVLPKEAP